jgi:RimJ/RimL family protein N-acetyltransferase
VGLSGYTGPGGTAEYGILIGEARFRGRGVAREASRQILRIGFEELGLEEVVLNAFEANASAIILYEKLGFERDARAAGPVFKDGVLKPTLRMRLSHSRWHAHEGNECCRTS